MVYGLRLTKSERLNSGTKRTDFARKERTRRVSIRPFTAAKKNVAYKINGRRDSSKGKRREDESF